MPSGSDGELLVTNYKDTTYELPRAPRQGSQRCTNPHAGVAGDYVEGF